MNYFVNTMTRYIIHTDVRLYLFGLASLPLSRWWPARYIYNSYNNFTILWTPLIKHLAHMLPEINKWTQGISSYVYHILTGQCFLWLSSW